jgi:hypothetical protein
VTDAPRAERGVRLAQERRRRLRARAAAATEGPELGAPLARETRGAAAPVAAPTVAPPPAPLANAATSHG